MELLWIDLEVDAELQEQDALFEMSFSIGSPPTAALRWSDPRVFAFFKLGVSRSQVGAAGVGLTFVNLMRRYEMQSKDGFGYLLASDSFNVNIVHENAGRVDQGFWRMFYRFVDIPLAEFVGIVQSNQQS